MCLRAFFVLDFILNIMWSIIVTWRCGPDRIDDYLRPSVL